MPFSLCLDCRTGQCTNCVDFGRVIWLAVFIKKVVDPNAAVDVTP